MLLMYIGLFVVVLIVGLVVTFLLNRWFRTDIEKCIVDAKQGKTDLALPSTTGKFRGAIGVYVFLVFALIGPGLYFLKQDRDSKVREIESLRHEEWTVKVPMMLEDTGYLDQGMVQVRVKPPDPRFPAVDSVHGMKMVILSKLAVAKPGQENLPTMYLSYPGYGEREVTLARSQITMRHDYDTVDKVVTIHEPVTLELRPENATSEGYSEEGSGIEEGP